MIAACPVTVLISDSDFLSLVAESLGDLVEKPYQHHLIVDDVVQSEGDATGGWEITYHVSKDG